MNTYAMKCNKCKTWCAKATGDLTKYRFVCPSCGYAIKFKSKRKTFANIDYGAILSYGADSVIRQLNEVKTDE